MREKRPLYMSPKAIISEKNVMKQTPCMNRERMALLRMVLLISSFRYSPICPKRFKALNSETVFSLVFSAFEISS